jgi:excisionase family DNA binding protein
VEKLLTLNDVENITGIPKSTLYQWRNRGIGPPSFKAGRHVRFRRTDVEAWIDGLAGGRAAA